MDRTVLCNCCENWILQWGEFYREGEGFVSLPHGHLWRKERETTFTDLRTSITYVVHDTKGFKHLEPVAGVALPLLNRCCSVILIEFGPKTQPLPLDFTCPVCKTPWSITQDPMLPLVPLFTNDKSGATFKLNADSAQSCLSLVGTRTPVS